jgi:hypothetical protein
LSKKGGVDETSKKTDLQGGRTTEVGRRCTRTRARGRARRQIAHPQWGSTSHRLCHRGRLSLESLAHTSFFRVGSRRGTRGGSGKGREVISGEYRARDLGIVGGLFPSCGRGARYWAPIPLTNSRTIQTMEL